MKTVKIQIHDVTDLPTKTGIYLVICRSGMLVDAWFNVDIGRFNCYKETDESNLGVVAWAETDLIYAAAYENTESYLRWWENKQARAQEDEQ